VSYITQTYNVTEIGQTAFSGCSGLSGSVTIPYSVTTIGFRAFDECRGISAVYYTGDIAGWCNISFIRSPFSNPLYLAHSLYINNELVTNLVIPEVVTEIKPYAFIEATCLTSLTISNSVITIGVDAFAFCKGLKSSLIIPHSVKSIGPAAFSGCTDLTGSLVIPNSVTSIGDYAFFGCGFTGDLIIPESVVEIGEHAFADCTGFSKVQFNPSYCINNGYFSWSEFPPFVKCGGTLEISGNMQDVPAYLFKKANFNEIIMYNSIHSIGIEAFAYCDSLKSITCWNENPPILENGVFEGINKDNVFVHVPCGKVSTYMATEGWDEFPNYEMFDATWLLKVTSNEPEHCETQIKQLPLCESGEAIVRAKPAPGYRFLGWYENDERVSQDTLYAFYLGTSRELEARVRSYTGLEDMVIVEANVYPNPISGQVKVEAENLKHITISNMFGKIIYDGNASGNEFAYDFSGYVAGVYLIRIETTSGVATKRVVVTR
jgi:hypothetical protein